MSNSDTSLRVLLMRGGMENTWIAVCLEHYIVAQGMSTEDVIREFKAMLAGGNHLRESNMATRTVRSRALNRPRRNTGTCSSRAKPFDPPSLSLDIIIDSIPDLSLPEVEQLRLAA